MVWHLVLIDMGVAVCTGVPKADRDCLTTWVRHGQQFSRAWRELLSRI
jgi:hypothetical protein